MGRRQAGRLLTSAEVEAEDRFLHRAGGSPVTLYLDTSSLVKLYVQETGSDDVRQLVDQANVVATSIVAYPETRAALARLRRSGGLTPQQFVAAKRDFETQWPAFLAVDVSASLSHEAGEYAERYALRGFDSLHLAAFAAIVRRAGPQTRFSSFDTGLNKAAKQVARSP
jgi:uncharacterized protein